MASRMIAPRVATKMDQMLNPVAPVPPSSPTTNPPMTAPTIPMRIVTMMPPGSSPGMISLPNTPAMSPTRIQLMMPTFLRPSLENQPALGDVPVMRTIPKQATRKLEGLRLERERQDAPVAGSLGG